MNHATQNPTKTLTTGTIVESFGTLCTILESFDDGYKAVIISGLTRSGRIIRSDEGVTFVTSANCRILTDDEINTLCVR